MDRFTHTRSIAIPTDGAGILESAQSESISWMLANHLLLAVEAGDANAIRSQSLISDCGHSHDIPPLEALDVIGGL